MGLVRRFDALEQLLLKVRRAVDRARTDFLRRKRAVFTDTLIAHMPKRTKKLLVYLDQNFISEMAKADVNVKVKQEWKDLFSLLKEGFLGEKLVVPQSWFHDVETSFAPVLKSASSAIRTTSAR